MAPWASWAPVPFWSSGGLVGVNAPSWQFCFCGSHACWWRFLPLRCFSTALCWKCLQMVDCSGEFCTILPGAGGGGSVPWELWHSSQVGEPECVWTRVTSHTYKTYLMISCCSKSDLKLHGDHSNASLLPVILLSEFFLLHSSVVKDIVKCLVQTFIPTSYQCFRVECLFVDGFINCSAYVFLPNLKWVGNWVNSYDKTENDCKIETCKSSPLKRKLQWGEDRVFLLFLWTACVFAEIIGGGGWYFSCLLQRTNRGLSLSWKWKIEVVTDLWRAVGWRGWRGQVFLFFLQGSEGGAVLVDRIWKQGFIVITEDLFC